MGGTSLGTWHQLSVDRQFTMTGAPSGQSRDRTVLFEIASDAAGATVVSSRNILFTSDNT